MTDQTDTPEITEFATTRGELITLGAEYVDAPGRTVIRTLRVIGIALRPGLPEFADITLSVVSTHDTETGQTATPKRRPISMTAARLVGRDFRPAPTT